MIQTVGDVLHLFVGRFSTVCLAVEGSMFRRNVGSSHWLYHGGTKVSKVWEPLKKILGARRMT